MFYGCWGHQCRLGALSYALIAVIFGSSAWADDLQVTVGAKVWANEWTSWSPVSTVIQTGSGATPVSVIEAISSNTHYSTIPQASVRYGRWLVSASYFASTNYSLGGYVNPATGELSALAAQRQEFDGNVGYYVLPGLALTAGYKRVQQDYQQGNNVPQLYKWTGPTFGVLPSATLRGPLAMYGTFAYGRLKLHATVPDAAGDTGFNADYLLGELGLSYGMNTPMRGVAVGGTLGYRVQVVSTRKFDVSTGFGGHEPVDVHDVTQGPAISVFARF